MTGQEPTMQVPVSFIDTLRDLIERNADYDPANPNARRSWDHGIDCESIEWGYDGIEGDSGDPCDCWVSVVADLLSQPTPTAEPRTCQWCERTATGDALHDGEANNSCGTEGHGHDFTPWNPAPPSIADMAPGTTFTAVIGEGVQRSQFQRVNAVPGSMWQVFEPGTGHYWHPKAIDPSTIRDVTPPTVRD